MRALVAAALAWIGACAAEATPPVSAEQIELEHAILRLADGSEIAAAEATLQADGRGEGTGLNAVIPTPGREAGTWSPPTATRPGGADGAPPMQIEAPRSSWDLRARTAHFEGGVTVTRGDVRLTCDVLEVEYGDPDRLQRATAIGSVRVTRNQREATGARAELTTATGEVALTGNPTLSEGPSSMRGERIVLWLDDERVDCEQCRLVVDGAAVAPAAGGTP